MGSKIVVVSLIVLVGVWFVLFTQGRDTKAEVSDVENSSWSDPSDRGEVVHLLETHGIRIGEASDSDILVKRSGEKIEIELTDKFLGEVPENLLGTLGWTRPTNWVSEEGFSNFLDSLHTFLVEEMPEVHGHSHGEDGHEHAHKEVDEDLDDHDVHEGHDHEEGNADNHDGHDHDETHADDHEEEHEHAH